ncbi:MAG TPA: hypothetical protein PLR06_00985 [Cyclobacteriaceae bacterium]|nr:hypothetical protein [Cyclobacteriaceae bacterium]
MNRKSIIILAVAILILASCENPMRFETRVHENGSLDKTITFEKADSTVAISNIFGINESKGWKVEITKLPQEDKSDKNSNPEFRIKLQKSFNSVEDINNELDTPLDSLFHINSVFEKKFRWFYTYIRYTETIRPINRFKLVSPEDYFNQEDQSFINRLPAEGTAISKADSLYLQVLNEKISEYFTNTGIFKEEYKILEEVLKKNSVDQKWLDTLRKKQDFIFNHIDKMKGETDFAAKMADSLKIPLPKPSSTRDFEEASKDFNSRLAFMKFARDGKYVNAIEMPWTVTNSNADSVSGNYLEWKPLVTKFIYKDYVMYAECRHLNFWALVVSGVIVGITVLVFRWKR